MYIYIYIYICMYEHCNGELMDMEAEARKRTLA